VKEANMSVITAANSSATNAVASLLSNVASSATTDAYTPATKATATDPAVSSASRAPVDTVDLSDRAKATLARARTEQVAADKLAALVQSVRGPQGKSGSASKSTSGDGSQLFDKLTGRVPSQLSGGAGADLVDPKDRDGYLAALKAAHTGPDGTIESFSKTVNDVFDVPSTLQDVNDWYNTWGQTLVAGAEFFPEEAATGIAQAVQNRTIKIQDAQDIPGLDLHNTLTFSGGEGGSAINGTASYNHDAAIFKDPNTNYRVLNGYVISWAKPEGDATLGVTHATGPIVLNMPAKIRF
jgi:hypothetical protein